MLTAGFEVEAALGIAHEAYLNQQVFPGHQA
jgi:hypothetical protein